MQNKSRRDILKAGTVGFGSICLSSVGYTGTPDVEELSWADLTPTGKAVLLPPVTHTGASAPQDTNNAEPVRALHGKLVRIPGFIIPLSFKQLDVVEFILAPYKGACIHVPAPPPNQLVHVQTDMPYPSARMVRPVWVSGVLQIKSNDTPLAQVGYRMQAETIKLYEPKE